MGVGISLRSGPLSEKAANGKLAELAQSAKNAFDNRELNKRVRAFLSENQLFLRFLSGEEDVEISYPEDRLVLTAKTSSLGPGYHAFLVRWLQIVDGEIGLGWQWDEEGYGDEAGFAASQDFGQLQDEMIRQLKSMATFVLETPDASNFRLNVDIDYPFPVDTYFAMHPLGFLSREWFERIQQAEGDDARSLASEFFAWWDDGEEGTFWHRLGLQRLWSTTAWHVPQSDDERAEMQFTLFCFDKARTTGCEMLPPERELNELRELVKPDAEERVPDAVGIGFLRREVEHQVSGGWRIQLPGYYHQTTEDDGNTQTFWFEDRTVRVSSMNVRHKDGRKASPETMLSLKDVNVAEGEHFEKDHLKGWAAFENVQDDGGDYLQLNGRMAATNSLCLVSVCVSDESEREWALKVWRSVFQPPPR